MNLARLFCATAALGLLAAFADTAQARRLGLWVDPDGTAYLHNLTDTPVSFDGYQIASESRGLDPAGWKSIQDYVAGGQINEVIAQLGAGGLTFGEANPSDSNLAELNLGGVGTLQPGAKWAIGKPFKNLANTCASYFFWSGPGSGSTNTSDIHCIPEPSTWLLAILATLGWLAIHARPRNPRGPRLATR